MLQHYCVPKARLSALRHCESVSSTPAVTQYTDWNLPQKPGKCCNNSETFHIYHESIYTIQFLLTFAIQEYTQQISSVSSSTAYLSSQEHDQLNSISPSAIKFQATPADSWITNLLVGQFYLYFLRWWSFLRFFKSEEMDILLSPVPAAEELHLKAPRKTILYNYCFSTGWLEGEKALEKDPVSHHSNLTVHFHQFMVRSRNRYKPWVFLKDIIACL